ncbi:hypothetical protein OsI_27079 [Oryza sativa Indica Group]|uniref:Uncharacterized protein n=1 Tax=Oryza sativa subsp. indica TaxID=39946 RepID=A2YP86_ORYSI|nr:hypothetical protein OsI_27079 [Oryza sativa Indica Group]
MEHVTAGKPKWAVLCWALKRSSRSAGEHNIARDRERLVFVVASNREKGERNPKPTTSELVRVSSPPTSSPQLRAPSPTSPRPVSIHMGRKVKQVPWWEGLKKKERQKRNVETMGFDPELENEAWSRWIDLEDHEDPLVDLIDFTGTANAPPSHSSLCLCLCHSMRQASSSFQLRRRHHIIRSYSTILCQWRS